MIAIEYQLPGSSPMGEQVFAKPFEPGDERRPATGPSKAIDAMGTETSASAEFGATELTFTIRQVPGPDRLNPYQVVIHAPFGQNLSGTIDGTRYELTWNSLNAGGGHSLNVDPGASLMNFARRGAPAGPVLSSVTLSPTELMMLPHDPRLAFDVEPESEPGYGDWIRLQATGPAGDVVQVFRIQAIADAGGELGAPGVAEEEVRTLCAPYLSDSVEKKCDVQVLKGASVNVYYCVMGNAAFAANPAPPAAQFRYLFLGVFRIASDAAVVVGNLSEKDGVNFRLMMEALGKVSTLPITTGNSLPVTGEGSVNAR